MKDVTGLCFAVLAVLVGSVSGTERSRGHCFGNQCYAVVRDPSGFTGAQNQCREKSGHLMTVRSSVSHDVLSILLGNISGRYWIGLHEPTGCPDPAAQLKGYEWVTKDSESEFSNWAPSFDSSCSAPRCVWVSEDDDFQWIQAACDAQATGFLCEYNFLDPCNRLDVAEGDSVMYRTSIGFEGEDLLSLPPGSTAIRMPAETKYVCFSQQWLQAPWTCEILDGGCEYKCAVDPTNAPSCYCPPGQTVNPANKVTCEVGIPDLCVGLRCQHACYKNGDTYACTCEQGFKLAPDGRSCVDFNDCTDKRQCPGENFACVNTPGGFQCVCRDGYRMSGGLCVDVDECVSAPCEHLCTNTPGSHECSCYDGYKVDPKSPDKCKLHCGEEECAAICDPNDNLLCFCPDGYIVDEREDQTFCIDINECLFQYCDQGCRNSFGSYKCSCNAGYTLVDLYMCVKNEGDDTDGSEGSGATAAPTDPTPTRYVPTPDPTRKPSGVSVGALVGIIICTVFCIVVVVFLANHFLCGRGKMESAGALKAPEGETHCLHKVTSDTC